ncbi:single-stranded DNA-binding protein [Lysinibacillus sp. FSL R7-0073]|uniref:single-stranded DNA-binding protein n=1 Tax=Lysinibacillus TaxID=400634 RepID=UPI00188249D0|nr:single-stranded DNA-binding protein [Lysinibacillus fusiformis]MBD8521433.1 single-stranded DNA-binding protein [Lysinibacillus fusiformis]
MINRVVLVGRLTKDPELRYTPNGIASCRFTVAVNRTFKGQNGEQEADFINCQAWRKQAENLANFIKKGSLIGLEGRIQTGGYKGQYGKRVFTTNVVPDSIQFLEPRNSTVKWPIKTYNLAKGIKDGLSKVIWHDDSQVTELVARKWYLDNPRAEVTIEW